MVGIMQKKKYTEIREGEKRKKGRTVEEGEGTEKGVST